MVMKWSKKESSFNYNGKPVTRTTMIAQTPLGEFKVYEAVGGNIFYVHPFMRNALELKINGVVFDGDPEGTFACNELRVKVKSIEEGISACEKKWVQVKEAVNKI